jgi:hypothetical protein
MDFVADFTKKIKSENVSVYYQPTNAQAKLYTKDGSRYSINYDGEFYTYTHEQGAVELNGLLEADQYEKLMSLVREKWGFFRAKYPELAELD